MQRLYSEKRIGSEEEAAKEEARTSARRDAHGTDRFAKLRRYGAFRQTRRLLSVPRQDTHHVHVADAAHLVVIRSIRENAF